MRLPLGPADPAPRPYGIQLPHVRRPGHAVLLLVQPARVAQAVALLVRAPELGVRSAAVAAHLAGVGETGRRGVVGRVEVAAEGWAGLQLPYTQVHTGAPLPSIAPFPEGCSFPKARFCFWVSRQPRCSSRAAQCYSAHQDMRSYGRSTWSNPICRLRQSWVSYSTAGVRGLQLYY